MQYISTETLSLGNRILRAEREASSKCGMMDFDWSEKGHINVPQTSQYSYGVGETSFPRADSLNDGEKAPSFDMFGTLPAPECRELGDLFRLESRIGTDEEAYTITTERDTRELTPLKRFTCISQLRSLLLSSWLNILLLFVPAGFIVAYLHAKQGAIFVVNFIALIPISGLLGFAMKQLMLQVGDGLSILVWMAFCNIVQTVASIFLLRSQQVEVLQTSLVGSTIVLTLFNIGCAFVWVGWKGRRRCFNRQVARTISSFLAVSVLTVAIPTAFDAFGTTQESSVVAISRGTSVILISVYLFYVLYEYKRKKHFDGEEAAQIPSVLPGCVVPRIADSKDASPIGIASSSIIGADRANGLSPKKVAHPEDENDKVKLSIQTSIIVLALGTAILVFNTQFMTACIPGIAEGAGAVSLAFIGLVLIPMLSNGPTAFQNAAQGEMDLAIQCALGRSLQMTLLVIPGSVLVAWMMGLEMALAFDGFYMAVLCISTLVVYIGISNGSSNWFLGVLFVAAYIIIAVTSWYDLNEDLGLPAK